MKLLKILFTLGIIYTIYGISPIYANTITPAINEIKLPQGQRTNTSAIFGNQEEKDIDILISVYEYDPKTDNILKESRNIFVKADTDTTVVNANSTKEIGYEIFPLENLEKGTYFNIVVFTPVIEGENVYINEGISQLVILHIIDQDQEIKGITTTDYTAKIEVLSKGIPFLTPLKLKYTITNNSNFVVTPKGRIDVFNKSGNYKPEYIYINKQEDKLYPNDVLVKDVEVNNWHISDIFTERMATGSFFNGLDSNSKLAEVVIPSYTYELMSTLILIVVGIFLIKSLKEDNKRK